MAGLELSPKTPVVVTGGASGIGRACARALAEVGRPVAIWDLDAARVQAEAEAIRRDFAVATSASPVDVRSLGAIAAAAIDPRRTDLGPIGGLVHAAGVSGPTPVESVTEESWDAVVDVNLRAEVFLTQVLLDDLRAAPGAAVVGIASIASLVGYAAIPAYCASKAGMLGLTRSLALALAGDGIRVNAVCPGNIDTPMTARGLFSTPERAERVAWVTPSGRIGTPDDIAAAVRFLLSDEAAYITGTQLVVDGGLVATVAASTVDIL